METLIENYLLKNHYCPLPSLGALELKEISASVRFGENILLPPYQKISFNTKEKIADEFISYIAFKKGIDEQTASQKLMAYCKNISTLDHRKEKKINHTGTFYIDNDGSLSFKQQELPEEFLPTVSLQRVIHPNSIHRIRVGDRERTSAFMKSYFQGIKKIKRSTWWIWAVLLTATAIASCFYYYKINPLNSSLFGNGTPVTPSAPQVKTYKAVN